MKIDGWQQGRSKNREDGKVLILKSHYNGKAK